MHGQRQSIETLINEEALLLAKYLRGEIDSWIPRVLSFPFPPQRTTLDTLISEEALLLAKYLRNERKEWTPRIPTL